MNLALRNSLTEAISLARGDSYAHDGQLEFPLQKMAMWRFTGLNAPFGHAPFNSDLAWESVVRALWSTATTWALCIAKDSEEVAWQLAFPAATASTADVIKAHLPGAHLEEHGEFAHFATRFQQMHCVAAMGGHPGTSDQARLETAMHSLTQDDLALLILAKPISRPEIQNDLSRLGAEEQFVRDEYISRESLERESHTRADNYLSLLRVAIERGNTALQEGGWRMRVLLGATNGEDFRKAQSLIHSAFASDGGRPEPLRWQDVNDPRALTFLRSGEVAALTRPPQRELPGFSIEVAARISESSRESLPAAMFATASARPEQHRAISIGRIIDDSNRASSWLEIAADEFCRHVLIAGMTGSGKSTTCEHLLLELWREHRIPWLVIEPGMKTAYRRLLNSEIGSDVHVRAVGVPHVARMGLNPMAVPVGISLAEHTAALFSIISAAFELVPPMPEVLATAIEQTYRNHGWNLSGSVPEGQPPRLRDLVDEIDRCTTRLGYSSEISGNIRAGLLLRLQRLLKGPLAPELAACYGVDFRSLVSRPTIIELSALPDADSQALVMGLLGLQLRYYWRITGRSDALRHVTLIEEAHRLLRAAPETAANASRNRAAQDVANMLSELRAFGAGLIIVDQTPSALVTSVIANTATKILHRLDHPADRELVGRAAGIPANHVDLLGKLNVGDAVVRCDRRSRPFRVRMPNPAVTYHHLPLPELQQFGTPAPVSAHNEENRCTVCGLASCAGRIACEVGGTLSERLQRLKEVSQCGEEAVWKWALDELNSAGITGESPDAPLCFLIGLCHLAGLPNSTLEKLCAAFGSRTTGNAS